MTTIADRPPPAHAARAARADQHERDVPQFRAVRVLAAIWAGAAAVLLLWWHDTPAIQNPGDWLTGAGRICGLLAGYGVVVLVALMARLPPLERGVGADRLGRWHAMGGRYVISLIVTHALLITWGYAASAHASLAGERPPRC